MSNDLPAAGLSWRRSRYGFAGFWFLSLLAAWFLLRLVLLLAFKPPALPAADVLLAFLSGFHRDVFAALVETIPLLCWMLIVPDRRVRGPVASGVVPGRLLCLLVRADLPAVRRVLLLRRVQVALQHRRGGLPALSPGSLHQHLGVVPRRRDPGDLPGPEPGLAVRGEPAVWPDVGAALLRQVPAAASGGGGGAGRLARADPQSQGRACEQRPHVERNRQQRRDLLRRRGLDAQPRLRRVLQDHAEG